MLEELVNAAQTSAGTLHMWRSCSRLHLRTTFASLVTHGRADTLAIPGGETPQTSLRLHAGPVRLLLKQPEDQKLLFGIVFGYELLQPICDEMEGTRPES